MGPTAKPSHASRAQKPSSKPKLRLLRRSRIPRADLLRSSFGSPSDQRITQMPLLHHATAPSCHCSIMQFIPKAHLPQRGAFMPQKMGAAYPSPLAQQLRCSTLSLGAPLTEMPPPSSGPPPSFAHQVEVIIKWPSPRSPSGQPRDARCRGNLTSYPPPSGAASAFYQAPSLHLTALP